MTILGSAVFGILFSCGNYLVHIQQLHLTSMAARPILQMLPYVVTIVVLILTSIRNKRENQPPAGLGVNYFREDR